MTNPLIHISAVFQVISFLLLFYLGMNFIKKESNRHKRVGVGLLFFAFSYLVVTFFLYFNTISPTIRASASLLYLAGIVMIMIELL
ncbi:MAG TPA: hypothetical protein VI894_00795 [Candidatus Nanoarchaeia archaeon]|nr:hypothetical protein [Candidatus Nanoarchaeia archaeon]